MKIDDVRIVGGPPVLAAQQDVDRLESRLWITFPDGYHDYVTRLGEGVLGSFVRVYPPWKIGKEIAGWRRRIAKYWVWDQDPQVLPKERALECVIVGDTLNGDELVFHPSRPGRLFVLPADTERVLAAGSDLLEAVEWIMGSGQVTEPLADRDFEPFDSRQQPQPSEVERGAGNAVDPAGESLADLVGLGQRWAERHALRKAAEQAAKKQAGDLARQFGAERTSTLLYEALVLSGKSPYEPGYLAVFQIADRSSRLEVGTLTWYKTEDLQGSSYAPNQANLAKLAKPT